MIAVVDYGVSNMQSVINMGRRAGAGILAATDAATIGRADKIILPGVGAFDRGMEHIRKLALGDALNAAVSAVAS